MDRVLAREKIGRRREDDAVGRARSSVRDVEAVKDDADGLRVGFALTELRFDRRATGLARGVAFRHDGAQGERTWCGWCGRRCGWCSGTLRHRRARWGGNAPAIAAAIREG